MSDAAISLLVLAAVVILFVWNRFPVEMVAIGSSLVLFGAGVIDVSDVVLGYGDAAVVMIAALFIVSEGLDATGVTTWIGQSLGERSGGSPRRLLVLTMLMCAGLTAVIGINGAVAALVPVAVMVALRQRYPTSRLMAPLAFAGSAGGVLLLTGSPVNVVISNAALAAGVGRFGLAEFALIGIPLVAGTILVTLSLGDRLLPDRVSTMLPPDLSAHASVLVRQYALDNVFHLRVTEASPLLGASRSGWDLSGYAGARVVTLIAAGSGAPVSDGVLAVGDRLTMVGDPDVARRYATDHHLRIESVRTADDVVRALLTRETGVVEVVVPPRSRFIGEPARPGQVLGEAGIVILAIQRQGVDHGPGEVTLHVGDVLLLEGTWDALDTVTTNRDALLVDSPDVIRRQTVPLGARSKRAIAVLALMVVLLATGIVPPAVAALISAVLMVMFGCVSAEQAYRRMSWSTVLLVAAMFPMSRAISKSGAGEMLATQLVGAVGGAGPIALLAALFALTVLFSQLISNVATALVVIPIAVSSAEQLGVSPRPVLMCVCIAAAAAFATPVATPANMMVMGPGGYRFGDYWRLGVILIGLFAVVAIGLVPLIWRF